MAVDRIQKEIENQKKRGVLLVLTGPTCAGKDTVMQKLLSRNKNMVHLVTTTSRPKRPGEVEGKDYHFVDRNEFERLISENAFLEWVEYLGHYKGGQKRHVEEALSSGKDVIWRIDVRGVKNIKKRVKEMIQDPSSPISATAFVFLAPPDLTTLKRRMEKRATEDRKVQKSGLDLAIWEMDQYDDSEYLVINVDDKLDKAVERVEFIVEAERIRVRK